jgi:hypothetical protein
MVSSVVMSRIKLLFLHTNRTLVLNIRSKVLFFRLQKLIYISRASTISFDTLIDNHSHVSLRPAWIKTSLRLRAVWIGSMLFAICFSTCNRLGKRTACIHAGWKPIMLDVSWRSSFISVLIHVFQFWWTVYVHNYRVKA